MVFLGTAKFLEVKMKVPRKITLKRLRLKHHYYNNNIRYYDAKQIDENEVGGACGTHGRGEKRV
jgi:hypothetical protein